MRKIWYGTMTAVLMMSVGTWAADVYTCGFEATDPSGMYTIGAVTRQGSPVWEQNYLNSYDTGGEVVSGVSYDGTQSLHLHGSYASCQQTSRVTLSSVTRAPWFEFAFKPNFQGINDDCITWMNTTRGSYTDTVGIAMQLTNNSTCDITIGGTTIGHFTNGQWQTISFKHQVSGGYYTGSFYVYLNGVYVTTLTSGSHVAYNGLQTIVFSSAESSWTKNGNWYVDNVHVGDKSNFVITEKTIGVVYSEYSYGDYNSATAWDSCLQGFHSWDLKKLSSSDIGEWVEHLNDYDVLLLTNLYLYNQSVDFGDYAAEINTWLQAGGLLIIEGALDSNTIGWLAKVDSAWTIGTSTSAPPGLPNWVDSSFLNPHVLPDGWRVSAYIMARVPDASLPDFTYGGLNIPACGQVLAMNKNSRPTIWTDRLGNGTVFVTSYYYGYGLEEYVLEDMFRWHWGQEYEASLSNVSSVAEQVLAYDMPSDVSPLGVLFDSNGVVRINGESFFPMGFYCVNRVDSLSTMQQQGFNFSYSNMGAAWTYGLRTMESMSWDNDSAADQIRNSITSNAILSWEVLEEPSNTDFNNIQVKYRAALAHRLDSSRPTCVLVNDPVSFEGYIDQNEIDLIVYDPYCIGNSFSSLKRIVNDMTTIKSLAPEKPVWVCLQAHACQSSGLRMPTAAQLRAEMYTALAAGAKGIVWFALDYVANTDITFLRGKNGDYLEPQWLQLCECADELTTMNSYLVATDTPVEARSNSSNIYARCFIRSSSPEMLLIVVNTSFLPDTVTLSWPYKSELSGSLFDSPSISIDADNGKISVTLGGYGVGVYLLKDLSKEIIAGDANGDGAVNISDLSLLAANYGTTSGATWAMGDFTGDGSVNVSDLSLLAANYGTGSSSTMSWADAYAQAFGTTSDAEDATDASADASEDTTSSACSSLGLSLVVGWVVLGLMLMKLEE